MNNLEIKPNLSRISLEAIDSILQKLPKEEAAYLALSIRYFIAKGVLYGSKIAMMPQLTDKRLIDGYEASNKEFEVDQTNLDNLIKKYVI